MTKDTRFVVRFNSRRDAALFYNAVQNRLNKEKAHNGFTEFSHVHHWQSDEGRIMSLFFKDPLTLEEARELSFGCDAEWKFLPSSYTFNDLLKLDWS